jgi:hypothetical protein
MLDMKTELNCNINVLKNMILNNNKLSILNAESISCRIDRLECNVYSKINENNLEIISCKYNILLDVNNLFTSIKIDIIENINKLKTVILDIDRYNLHIELEKVKIKNKLMKN